MTPREAVEQLESASHALHNEFCCGEYDVCRKCAEDREALQVLKNFVYTEVPRQKRALDAERVCSALSAWRPEGKIIP